MRITTPHGVLDSARLPARGGWITTRECSALAATLNRRAVATWLAARARAWRDAHPTITPPPKEKP